MSLQMWTLFFIFLHIRKTVGKPLIFTKRLQYILLPGALTPSQGAHWVLKLGVQCHWMGYNCCFFLNFVPLQIESPYNFGGTGPILGVKNPLQRVNGHAAFPSWYDIWGRCNIKWGMSSKLSSFKINF